MEVRVRRIQQQLKGLSLTSLIGVVTFMVGCSTHSVAVKKSNCEVETRMSSSIFLDPMHAHKRMVFLQLRSPSDKEGLNLESHLLAALEAKGYQVVPYPEQAQYWLQANVVRVGKTDRVVVEQAFNSGFGTPVEGRTLGGTARNSSSIVQGKIGKSGDNERDVGSAGVGILDGFALDSKTQNWIYSAVVDIQISERMGNSIVIKEKSSVQSKLGVGGHQEITSTEKVVWKRYQTRVMSTAFKGKINLKLEQAAPHLFKGLSHSIAGIF